MDLTEQKISGLNEICIEDSLNAAALKLNIKAGANNINQEGGKLTIYVDKAQA